MPEGRAMRPLLSILALLLAVTLAQGQVVITGSMTGTGQLGGVASSGFTDPLGFAALPLLFVNDTICNAPGSNAYGYGGTYDVVVILGTTINPGPNNSG